MLAVGSPFGLNGTVALGMISSIDRDIGSGPYDLLQIDASINRGNSGGPSVDLDGKVVGVNNAIYSPNGGSVGIAFAIPASLAQEVVEKLKATGKVSSGWLGVQLQNVDDQIAKSLGLEGAGGALVAKILPDAPAAISNLKEQDVILKVDNRTTKDSRDLARVIASYQPNATVALHVWRKGHEQNIAVKLGEFPDTTASNATKIEDLGLALFSAPGLPVVIVGVDTGSKAADQGIKSGDIVAELNNKPVSTVDDVSVGIGEARGKGKRAVLLQIRGRDGQSRFFALPLPELARQNP